MLPNKSNYFEDAEASPAPEQTQGESSPKEEEGDAQTAEIPKAVLGGKQFKPGEEVSLQVVQVMENSVLVKYASGEKEEPQKEEAPPEAMAGPQGSEAGGLYE